VLFLLLVWQTCGPNRCQRDREQSKDYITVKVKGLVKEHKDAMQKCLDTAHHKVGVSWNTDNTEDE